MSERKQILIRIPEDIHKALKIMAAKEDSNINKLINEYILRGMIDHETK
jgi:predicted HicB family RNase H-like nuclease